MDTLSCILASLEKEFLKYFLGVLRQKSLFLNGQKELEILYPIDIVQKGLAEESNP